MNRPVQPALARLDPDFVSWIATSACALDSGEEDAASVLPRLAEAGVTAAGVPFHQGGVGGDIVDGIAAVSAVAEESLAAAFVLWGHRTYIEYLLQSPNGALAEELLPDLLSGRVAGATGLSNAMKFLAGLEPLQIAAREGEGGLTLTGKMPWVTNLRPQGYHVAAAVDHENGQSFIASLSSNDAGLARSDDLALFGMQSTNTAAIRLDDVRIGADRVLHADARSWLPRVRPAFLGLQCGMSIGLARRSLGEALKTAGAGRGVLSEPLHELSSRLAQAESRLFAGVRARDFEADAAPLFEIRIALADIAAEAVSLELHAAGGKAYLREPGRQVARRWREVAFIPLITPSLVQLKTALQQQRRSAA
jgi:alkylation response protein AidB-like acyl-CoA dehydrogenase